MSSKKARDTSAVYVVFGITGEFSDVQIWTVAAYLDEDDARKHVESVNAWCESNGCDSKRPDEWSKTGLLELPECPWDENFNCQYTGTDYYYETVPVGGYPTS